MGFILGYNLSPDQKGQAHDTNDYQNRCTFYLHIYTSLKKKNTPVSEYVLKMFFKWSLQTVV